MKFIASPNHSKRNGDGKIKKIVLHYTDSQNFDGTVSWFQNPKSGVSTHYVVGREGQVVQMVEESRKAWHAGNHNSDSIGIENSADKDDKLTASQETALVALLRDILIRNNLPWRCITAHRFTAGNENHTNCPANLWPTKQALEEWKEKHFGTAEVKPASETIKLGSKGELVVKLHGLLVQKNHLGPGFHGVLFTVNTEAAVKWFQRTNGLFPDGIVGPRTWAALKGERPVFDTKVITLKRTGMKMSNGLELLSLKCGSLDFVVVSGQPNKQNFRLPSDPKSFPGNMEPLPQGNYEFGNLIWAYGFENFSDFNESGLAPLFIELIASFNDDRGSFGLHHEGTIPGTAGCIAFQNLGVLKQFYEWYKVNKPINLLVQWGL
jgi:N-acetylmuramoyl-L-alanine amidase